MFHSRLVLAAIALFRLSYADNIGTYPRQELEFINNDLIGGLWQFQLGVGHPEQLIKFVIDTTSSDIFIHSAKDKQYLDVLCKQQTPVPTCQGACKLILLSFCSG